MLPIGCIAKPPIKSFIAAFSLWLISGFANAVEYPEHMIFQNVIADSDIGVGEVEAIVQDRDGFLFFGGRNGLLRYDAYDFLPIHIEPDPADTTKPTNVSQTVDLFIDSRDRLWVATRLGLYQYDRDYVFDSSKFEKRFNFKATSPQESVQQLIKMMEN